MKCLFLILSILIFASCSNDCSECEQKLKACTMTEPIFPVDLPEPHEKSYDHVESILEIRVTADDKYLYGDSEYSFDEIVLIIEEKIADKKSSERKLKISGDKMAHYDAVFALITFSEERDISPILTYQE